MLNPEAHTFHSEKFRGVVDEAIAFFERTPAYSLPPSTRFTGAGVYALYYTGGVSLYRPLAEANREALVLPIYFGKATPPGWRTGRFIEGSTTALHSRLRQHARSIEQATNLKLPDFHCRFMILAGIEGDIVVPVEAEMIRRYRLLWNMVVDGFGNHDPGKGRYNQANSEWDILHPGKPWAARLTGTATSLAEIKRKIRAFRR